MSHSYLKHALRSSLNSEGKYLQDTHIHCIAFCYLVADVLLKEAEMYFSRNYNGNEIETLSTSKWTIFNTLKVDTETFVVLSSVCNEIKKEVIALCGS